MNDFQKKINYEDDGEVCYAVAPKDNKTQWFREGMAAANAGLPPDPAWSKAQMTGYKTALMVKAAQVTE